MGSYRWKVKQILWIKCWKSPGSNPGPWDNRLSDQVLRFYLSMVREMSVRAHVRPSTDHALSWGHIDLIWFFLDPYFGLFWAYIGLLARCPMGHRLRFYETYHRLTYPKGVHSFRYFPYENTIVVCSCIYAFCLRIAIATQCVHVWCTHWVSNLQLPGKMHKAWFRYWQPYFVLL